MFIWLIYRWAILPSTAILPLMVYATAWVAALFRDLPVVAGGGWGAGFSLFFISCGYLYFTSTGGFMADLQFPGPGQLLGQGQQADLGVQALMSRISKVVPHFNRLVSENPFISAQDLIEAVAGVVNSSTEDVAQAYRVWVSQAGYQFAAGFVINRVEVTRQFGSKSVTYSAEVLPGGDPVKVRGLIEGLFGSAC